MSNVSIVIPVYNAEKTLERCLEALLNQTYKDFEVICVDDNSKDNSLEVLNKFAQKDSRIKVFHQENHGPAYTRNFGISKAGGKYLMFCDADDWYEPDMIEEMVKTLEYQEVDFVECDCYINDISTDKSIPEGYKKYCYIKNVGRIDISKNNYNDINAIIWNKIFRMDFIKQYNITYPIKYEHDDQIFVLKYMANAKSCYILNKKLYSYSVGNTNSVMGLLYSKSNYGKEFDFIYSYYELFDYLKNSDNNDFVYYIKDKFINTCINFILLLKPDLRKEALTTVRNYILNSPMFEGNNPKLIEYIKKEQNYKKIIDYSKGINLNFFQKIFSVINNGRHKIITIFGFKIRLKQEKYLSKIKLFIAYHKPENLLKNDVCVPINVGRTLNHQKDIPSKLTNEDIVWLDKNMIGDDTGDNISYLNRKLNEITGIYWVWKNYERIGNPDIVGFLHYRTLFMLHTYPQYCLNYLDSLGYTVPQINYMLRNKKAITGEWVEAYTINHKKAKRFDWTCSCVSQYASYQYIQYGHNIIFYDALLEIIKTKFKKEYRDFYNWSMKPYRGGPFKNLFITRKKEFFKYCEWLFPIVFAMVERFKDYKYEDPLEIRNLSWVTELLTAYYFDKYVGKSHCRRLSAFRPN